MVCGEGGLGNLCTLCIGKRQASEQLSISHLFRMATHWSLCTLCIDEK